MRIVIVPGINGSGPEHWQSAWEQEFAREAVRIAPASWDEPDLSDWLEAIDVAVGGDAAGAGRPDVVFIAHSMGCLAAAAWVERREARVAGLYLVAPPDPDGPVYPSIAAAFGVGVQARPDAPALVVMSDDDPYCSPARSAEIADGWGAELVSVGAHGHLNSASGLGEWREGRALFDDFVSRLRDSTEEVADARH